MGMFPVYLGYPAKAPLAEEHPNTAVLAVDLHTRLPNW